MSLDIHFHLDSETVNKLLAIAVGDDELHFNLSVDPTEPEPDSLDPLSILIIHKESKEREAREEPEPYSLDPVGRAILGKLYKEMMESKEGEDREETSTQYLNQLEKSLGLKRPVRGAPAQAQDSEPEDPPTGSDPGDDTQYRTQLEKLLGFKQPPTGVAEADARAYDQRREEPETVDEAAKAFGIMTPGEIEEAADASREEYEEAQRRAAFGLDTTTGETLVQLDGVVRHGEGFANVGGDPGRPRSYKKDWFERMAEREDGCPSVSAGGPGKAETPFAKMTELTEEEETEPTPRPQYEQWPGMGEPEVPPNEHNEARNREVLDEDMKRWLGEFPYEDCPEKSCNEFILDLIETYGDKLVGESIRRVIE